MRAAPRSPTSVPQEVIWLVRMPDPQDQFAIEKVVVVRVPRTPARRGLTRASIFRLIIHETRRWRYSVVPAPRRQDYY